MAYLRIARIGAPRSNPTPAHARISEKIRCAYVNTAQVDDDAHQARYILRDAAGPHAPSVTYVKRRNY